MNFNFPPTKMNKLSYSGHTDVWCRAHGKDLFTNLNAKCLNLF